MVVEKINLVSRHTKPRKQGDQGGILQKEAPLYACKVQAGVPQVQQAHRPRPQAAGRRQEGPRLQEVRRRDLREEE